MSRLDSLRDGEAPVILNCSLDFVRAGQVDLGRHLHDFDLLTDQFMYSGLF